MILLSRNRHRPVGIFFAMALATAVLLTLYGSLGPWVPALSIASPYASLAVGAALGALLLWGEWRLRGKTGTATEVPPQPLQTLRRVLDGELTPIAYIDRAQRYVTAHAAYRALLGDGVDDLVGRRVRDGLGDLRYREVRAAVEQALAGSGAIVESHMVEPCGGSRPVALHYVPDTDESGRTKGVFVLVGDAAAQRHIEDELRDSEQRFKDFAEVASDWFFETDAEHRFTYVSPKSPQIAEVTGLTPEQFLGKTLLELPGEIIETAALQAHLVDIANRRPFQDFVYTRRLPDGSEWTKRASGKPIFDANGRFAGYRGAGRDITREKRAEDEKLTAELRFARAIERMPAAISLYDASDRLVMCNQWQREIAEAGSTPMEPGMSFERGLRAYVARGGVVGTDSEIETWLARRLSRRARQATSNQSLRNDGRWYEYTDFLLPDDSVLTIGTDITDRKLAEQFNRAREADLARLQRRSTMGEMAAAMAHELNQPLTAVTNFSSGCLRRLRSGRANERDLAEVMELICQESRRASNVLRRIGGFVGKSEPEKAQVPVDEIVESAITLANAELNAEGVVLERHIVAGLPHLLVSRIEIEQVVLNLVRNAIEAMENVPRPRRRITIEATSGSPGEVQITVRDTGPGFAADVREHLFEPFFTTKPDGMGMGLNICRTIVEAHDGAIWADSDGRLGAVVGITIPTVQPIEEHAA